MMRQITPHMSSRCCCVPVIFCQQSYVEALDASRAWLQLWTRWLEGTSGGLWSNLLLRAGLLPKLDQASLALSSKVLKISKDGDSSLWVAALVKRLHFW